MSKQETTEEAYAFVQGTVNSPGQEFTFWAESMGERAVKRLLGCVILGAMPEEGLEEALSTLRDIFDFSIQAMVVPLPARGRRRGSGQVVTKSQRPELIISE